MNKYWFVYFDITNNQTKQTVRKQSRKGINFYKDKHERIKEGKALVRWWKQKLENGWMPETWDSSHALIYPTTGFNQALDFALNNTTVSSKTKRDYTGTVNFVKSAAEKLGISNMEIKDVDQPHIMMIFKKIKESREWTNHAYNKHLGYFGAVLSRLIEWKVIKFNPAEKIKRLPWIETQMYQPYTEAERKLITDHLYLNHYLFFVYLLCIYHTGIRPKELLALTIADVDLNNETFTIYPDLDLENSKTRKIRRIPVNRHLGAFLRQMDLHTYPKHFYLFGSPYESGKGNKSNGTKNPDYFKPSAVQIKRDTVTKMWKKIIVEGLGINKHLYAAKHSGADAKILAGIDLDALKEMYGHSSKFMTEKYVSVLKEVHKKKIIELSPGF